MAENSKIEWTHHTFNPWIGCSKVSAGCKNCYAEADMDNRRKRVVWGINGTRSVTAYSYWRNALKWNRDAQISGERRRVFCASLADVFENWDGPVVDAKGNALWWPEDDFMYLVFDVQDMPTFSHQTVQNEEYVHLKLDAIRKQLFKLIERTPNLDWLLLTKRPENIMNMVPEDWQIKFPDNVWIGTSVENQEMADLRLPELLKVPAKVRFLSCEPQLEEVVFDYRWLREWCNEHDMLSGGCTHSQHNKKEKSLFTKIHWVIQGGESGHSKREFKIAWAYSMRDQCLGEDVAYFFKQIDKKQSIPEDLLIRQFPN